MGIIYKTTNARATKIKSEEANRCPNSICLKNEKM